MLAAALNNEHNQQMLVGVLCVLRHKFAPFAEQEGEMAKAIGLDLLTGMVQLTAVSLAYAPDCVLSQATAPGICVLLISRAFFVCINSLLFLHIVVKQWFACGQEQVIPLCYCLLSIQFSLRFLSASGKHSSDVAGRYFLLQSFQAGCAAHALKSL